MRRRLLACLGLGLVLVTSRGWAADPAPTPLRPGDVMPALTLEDQHGAQHVVDAAVRVILFSRDMDGGEILKTALADLPPGALEAAGAVYVSDISGMPGFVVRLFALPRMRRRPYAMLLDRTGEATALLPDEPGHATLIHLQVLQIEGVEHFATSDALRERLLELGTPAPAP